MRELTAAYAEVLRRHLAARLLTGARGGASAAIGGSRPRRAALGEIAGAEPGGLLHRLRGERPFQFLAQVLKSTSAFAARTAPSGSSAMERASPRGRALEFGGGDDAIDEPHLVRLLGGQGLSGEEELEGAPQPHDAREAVRAAAVGDEAHPHERARDLRGRGGDAQIAREREVQPRPRREAADRGDRRDGVVGEAHDHRLEAGEDRVESGAALLRIARQVIEVRAEGEGPAPAGKDEPRARPRRRRSRAGRFRDGRSGPGRARCARAGGSG